MTGKEWDDFYARAGDIAERKSRTGSVEYMEDLIVKVATECKRAGIDLPKSVGTCAGCVCHEINRPDGGVFCAAGECIEQEAL